MLPQTPEPEPEPEPHDNLANLMCISEDRRTRRAGGYGPRRFQFLVCIGNDSRDEMKWDDRADLIFFWRALRAPVFGVDWSRVVYQSLRVTAGRSGS